MSSEKAEFYLASALVEEVTLVEEGDCNSYIQLTESSVKIPGASGERQVMESCWFI